MTYVKRGAQILLVDDSKVDKYTGEGFKVFTPQGKVPTAPKPSKTPKNKPNENPEEKDDGSNGK